MAISLVEFAVVWGSVGIAFAFPTHDWHWLGGVINCLVIAGLTSVVIAVIGIFRDPERVLAFLALLLGLFITAICSVPLGG